MRRGWEGEAPVHWGGPRGTYHSILSGVHVSAAQQQPWLACCPTRVTRKVHRNHSRLRATQMAVLLAERYLWAASAPALQTGGKALDSSSFPCRQSDGAWQADGTPFFTAQGVLVSRSDFPTVSAHRTSRIRLLPPIRTPSEKRFVPAIGQALRVTAAVRRRRVPMATEASTEFDAK